MLTIAQGIERAKKREAETTNLIKLNNRNNVIATRDKRFQTQAIRRIVNRIRTGIPDNTPQPTTIDGMIGLIIAVMVEFMKMFMDYDYVMELLYDVSQNQNKIDKDFATELHRLGTTEPVASRSRSKARLTTIPGGRHSKTKKSPKTKK